MSNKANLKELFSDLQKEMSIKLNSNRDNIEHPVQKGDTTELCWVDMFKKYLPHRYNVEKGFVIDSNGERSDFIDIIIFDRQYSPFMFNQGNTFYIPAESVYAVFESKQALNKKNIKYAGKKAASVRNLKRTSAQIINVGGKCEPRKLFPILSGFLSLKSDWSQGLGSSFTKALKELSFEERLDLGCSLDDGAFDCIFNKQKYIKVNLHSGENTLLFFFFNLLGKLQSLGTVSAIEFSEYEKFFVDDKDKFWLGK